MKVVILKGLRKGLISDNTEIQTLVAMLLKFNDKLLRHLQASMANLNLTIFFVIGFVCITIIDTIGAIASRKLNFKYVYLSIFSFATYIMVSYQVSKEYGLMTALFANGILGLYDGTIGFWFSIVLKAHHGQSIEQLSEMLGVKSAITMILLAGIFPVIGYGIVRV